MTDGAPDVDRQLEHLDGLIDAGRSAAAKSRLEVLLAETPDDPLLLCVLARAELKLGEPARALAAAEAAAPGLPAASVTCRLAALAQAALKRPVEARAAALEAVRREPDLVYAHLVLAQVSLGYDNRLAFQAAVHATELDPEDADAHYLVGLAADWNRDYRTGEQAYRKVLELRPGDSRAQNNLGARELERGSPVAALRRFVDAAAEDPTSEVARRNVDIPLTRWLRAGLLVIGPFTVLGMAPGDGRAFSTISVTACLVVAGGYVRLRLPRRVRRVLWSYPRRHRGLAGAALAVGLLFFAAAGASLFSAAVSLALSCVTLVLVLVTLVAQRVRSRRRA